MPQIDLFIFCSLCSFIFIIIVVLLSLVEKYFGDFCTKNLKVRTKLYAYYNSKGEVASTEVKNARKVLSVQSKLFNLF